MRWQLAAGAALPAIALAMLASGLTESPLLALAGGMLGVAFVQLMGAADTHLRALALALGLLAGLAISTVSLQGAVPVVLVDVVAADGPLRSVVGFSDGDRLGLLARPIRIALPGGGVVLGAWLVAVGLALALARVRAQLALALAGCAALVTLFVALGGVSDSIGQLDAAAVDQLVRQQQPVGAGRASTLHASTAAGPYRMGGALAWAAVGVSMLMALARGWAVRLRPPAGADVRGATLLTCAMLAAAGLLGFVVALGAADVRWFSTAPLARVHALAMVGIGLVLTGAMRRERVVLLWLGAAGAALGYILASLQVFR